MKGGIPHLGKEVLTTSLFVIGISVQNKKTHLHNFFLTSTYLYNMGKNISRKLGKCVCKNCNIEFEKPLSEIKRNEKFNRPNFCSRTCVGKNNIKNFGEKRSTYDISKHSDNRNDLHTKFKYHYRNISKRNQEINVTIDDLKNQWEKQNGICPFTGIILEISSYSKIKKNPIYSASLDRIDSTKGYIKGNIRWVSRAINWMKNDMPDSQLNELINILIKNKRGPI